MKIEIDWLEMAKAVAKAAWPFVAGAFGGLFSGCARRATVASALTANVIRHGICGSLLRAAMRRIAIQPHLHKPYAIR